MQSDIIQVVSDIARHSIEMYGQMRSLLLS